MGLAQAPSNKDSGSMAPVQWEIHPSRVVVDRLPDGQLHKLGSGMQIVVHDNGPPSCFCVLVEVSLMPLRRHVCLSCGQVCCSGICEQSCAQLLMRIAAPATATEANWIPMLPHPLSLRM